MELFKRRIFAVASFILACCAVLVVQAARWQIALATPLAKAAVSQRKVSIGFSAERGRLLDRRGRDLCDPVEEWALVAVPQEDPWAEPKMRRCVEEAAGVLGMPARELLDDIQRCRPAGVIARNLDDATAASINELRAPWLRAVRVPVRYGPGSLSRHVVGYVRPADGVGADGYEGVLDAWLSGRDPGETALYALVDGAREVIPGLGYRAASEAPREGSSSGGCDVVLTLDAGIQRIVESVMDERVSRGAAVVLDAATGEVLAMASRPNFEQRDVAPLLGDSRGSLINRAISGYMPGSVFKIVVAAAAIETGAVSEQDVYFCKGQTTIGGKTMKCYASDTGGHGALDLVTALAESCNVAFSEIGAKVGAREILRYASAFGFGSRTELGLPGEAAGVLPSAGELGRAGMANLAIGQGGILATPLQVAQMMQSVASGGELRPASLLKELRDRGGVRRRFSPPEPVRVIKAGTADVIRSGLELAVTSGTGTLAQPGTAERAAGKTGTAEIGRFTQDGRSVAHAWFAGYWPIEDPRFVACVFIEEGMAGSAAAAPAFREIMEAMDRGF